MKIKTLLILLIMPILSIAQTFPVNNLTAAGTITSTGAVTAPQFIGNASTATSIPYSGLTGTVPIWNQNTIGNATNVTGVVAQANGGTGTTGFLQSGTGAITRSWTSKTQEIKSIQDCGAVPNTGADETSVIQACLNSGATSLYVPPGKYNFSSLIMPTIIGFTFFGAGTSSVLVQTGTGITWPTRTTHVFDSASTIKDLSFDGTLGTGHTLDSTYVQTIDFINLYFNEVPIGYDSIKLDGNPTDGTYMHDVRIRGLRIYGFINNGNAGIELGSYASDTLIDNFIMQGGFVTNYCILADSNAQTTVISNSHPYNAKINVVKLVGSNGNFGWSNVIFDNALQDVFHLTGATNNRFTNVYFEAIPPGYSGLLLDNSYNNNVSVINCSVSSSSASSCVKESNGSSGNKVNLGQIDSSSNYTKPFLMTGNGSFATGIQGISNYNIIYNLTGTVQTAQSQGTTQNLGQNSGLALTNAAWAIPVLGQIISATISTDATPAVGQTFTFNLQVGGVTVGSGTIPSGSYSVNITPSAYTSVSPGQQVSIQSVFSATSGSASPRYSVTFSG